MVALFAQMQVQSDKVAEALAACRTVRGPSQAEPGCLRYDFYQSPDDPSTIVFFEEWESREILDAHFGEPHFKAFFDAVSPLMMGAPSIRIYAVTSHENL